LRRGLRRRPVARQRQSPARRRDIGVKESDNAYLEVSRWLTAGRCRPLKVASTIARPNGRSKTTAPPTSASRRHSWAFGPGYPAAGAHRLLQLEWLLPRAGAGVPRRPMTQLSPATRCWARRTPQRYRPVPPPHGPRSSRAASHWASRRRSRCCPTVQTSSQGPTLSWRSC
jgi:hypothetical protein